MIRRILVKATTKQYGSLFNESLISNNIYTKKEFFDYINNKGDKNLYIPTDDQFKKAFHDSKLTNKYSRGILYLLEASIRDADRHSNSLFSMNRYSLEHLMPKKWENNWDTPKTQEEIDYRNNKLLTIGNLTIITQSLNSNINDADWPTKLNGRGKHSGLKAYSSGIETIQPYLERDTWDERSIEDRADFLYDKASEVWQVSNK
jgi:hypothetical protein